MTDTKKPREFWVSPSKRGKFYKFATDSLDGCEDPENMIHVREVVNIDWQELWAKTNLTIRISMREQIEELVERALRGEL